MQLSIKRFRIGLLTSAVLLLLLLVGYLAYGRYRLIKRWKSLAQKYHVSISHETNGYTYSQALGGRTIYTLHAAKAIQHDNDTLSLHDVAFTFYGQKDGAVHHVYGSDFEYDSKEGVAHAIGEVHMDIQVPQALGDAGRSKSPNTSGAAKTSGRQNTPQSDSKEAPNVIHVKTSGLVYSRNLGVAATDQLVEFQYGGIQGTSKGAEFDTNQNILHLLAEVKAAGIVRGQAMRMTAVKADLDHDANAGDFTQPVIYSEDRTIRSQHALVHFRQDGSISDTTANGSVVITSGTQEAHAAHMDATFGATSLPEKALFSGGVTLVDTNPLKPMNGAATTVNMTFDAAGNPAVIDAIGSASLAMEDHRSPAQVLRRRMNGDHIVSTFVPIKNASDKKPAGSSKNKTRLSEVHATGSAHALGDSLTAATAKSIAQLKTTQIAADDLYAEFGAGPENRARLDTIHGTGHTQLQQDAPTGAQQISTGDTLQMAFAPDAAKAAGTAERITSAVQSGHVVIHSRPAPKPGDSAPPQVTNASADRGTYDGATDRLTLAGNAHIADPSTSVVANTVVLDQNSGDAEAHGSVLATLLNTKSGKAEGGASAPGAANDPQITHVTSANATLHHQSKQAEFHGTDALPARLWQGGSQVEAANLFLDSDRHTLVARPASPGTLLHAVFASAPKPASTAPGSPVKDPSATNVVRVASQRMDYSDVQREAVFAGAVHIDATTGNVQAQRAVVFLTPAANKQGVPGKPAAATGPATQPDMFNGSLDHVVITGDVQLEQPGRHGVGEQLLYTAATGIYVLTGSPGHLPHVVDAKQGNITGTSLLFGDSGSTIVVAGAPATQQSAHTRVHTETDIPK